MSSKVVCGVYLINIKGTDVYKIGYTSCLEKRLKSLQSDVFTILREARLPFGPDYELVIVSTQQVGCKAAAKKVEKNLHHKFRDYRIGRREWFHFPSNIVPSIHAQMVIESGDIYSIPRFICGVDFMSVLDTWYVLTPEFDEPYLNRLALSVNPESWPSDRWHRLTPPP